MYNCKVITIPKIKVSESLEEVLVKTAKINKRFKLEASLKEIPNDLMDRYLKKNYETCGMFWIDIIFDDICIFPFSTSFKI